MLQQHEDERIVEVIEYMYFSKAGKIICDFTANDDFNTSRTKRDKIDAKAGWNKIYCHSDYYADGSSIKECNTKNILTKELKWVIETK
ncbi:hypothetical protein R83H12_02789 [Fibrobacteria bacterium R8-3-H12]